MGKERDQRDRRETRERQERDRRETGEKQERQKRETREKQERVLTVCDDTSLTLTVSSVPSPLYCTAFKYTVRASAMRA